MDAPAKHPHFHMNHPGPLVVTRITTAQSSSTVHLYGKLPAGTNLHDTVFNIARSLGATSGGISLQGGAFSRTRFTTGGVDRHNSGKAANYTWIRDWGTSHIISGEISFGLCNLEEEFVHCHALMAPVLNEVPDDERPAQPVIGGHLMARECIIAEPIEVFITLYDGFDIVRTSDAETLHAIFEPVDNQEARNMPEAANTPEITLQQGRFGRVFFVRIRPNEDLVEGLEAACRDAGITSAVLRGSIGSVNRQVFDIGGGREHEVDSIGLEITTLKGSISPDTNGNPRAELSGALVDDEGTVHAGRFVRGKSPICITAEICIEEWLPEQV